MAFNLPVQDFFSVSSEPNEWVRPTDWPVITDAPNEVQFLMSDINNASCTVKTQFSRTSGSQNIVIDWGDGTTDTITSTGNTDTTHQYTPGSGTPCSRGYTTFVIRVYFTGTGLSILSNCRLYALLSGGNTAAPYVNVGLLEIYHGDGTQTVSMNNYYLSASVSGISSFPFLEYVKLPVTVTFTLISNAFENCISLAKVVMPTSASSWTTVTSMFANCNNLRSIIFPSNATALNSLSSVFSSCGKLTFVVFPTSLNSCSTISSCFSGCSSLKNVTFPSINTCTNLSSCFTNCSSLEWVRFISLPTFGIATPITCSSMFNNCYNLQNVYFPATCSANANYDFLAAFTNCFNLKVVVFPNGFNPSGMSGAFQTCTSLVRVVFQSNAASLTTLSNIFNTCSNLTSVTFPPNVSASGIALSNAFVNCISLKTVTIPDTYLVTTLNTTFSGCTSLKTINWTPGAQNSLTDMTNTFNLCYLLSSFTMPTSMNSLTSLQSTFNGCRSISRITFPASLNLVANATSLFSGCYNLESVTMPTSMSACTTFSASFRDCYVIRRIVFPNVVSASTTSFSNAFNGCFSLESVTFPGAAQLNNISTLAAMFTNCNNLQTVTNLEKLGSLTASPLIAAAMSIVGAPSLTFGGPFSRLTLPGSSSVRISNLQGLRLLNTSAGQWTGSSPQIDISFTNISTANIVALFQDIAAQGNVSLKTISVTGAVGAAGLTAADRLIVTSKGWTITG